MRTTEEINRDLDLHGSAGPGQYHQFDTGASGRAAAEDHRTTLKRLGWRVFDIFQTGDHRWAFWTNGAA